MEMSPALLVRSLFDGPLDIIADIHGEYVALLSLLKDLGYHDSGEHPEDRRLVFLGDLVDRGPNSPAVVRLVDGLISEGLAQCVLGNHELNLLKGEKKQGSAWFYGKSTEDMDGSGRGVPQTPADQPTCERALRLFRQLPLALERDDLRVVHACWSDAAVEQARRETDAVSFLAREEARIENELRTLEQYRNDPIGKKLARQNGNPVKVLTSGPERRVAEPFFAGGKWRHEGRLPWWETYTDPAFCVFGHYWRLRLPNDADGDFLFDDSRPFDPLGPGRATCIDYSVGKRWRERPPFGPGEPFRTFLAALRWPEAELVFEGQRIPLVLP